MTGQDIIDASGVEQAKADYYKAKDDFEHGLISDDQRRVAFVCYMAAMEKASYLIDREIAIFGC